jgi:putative ABC transport system permease protein
MVRLALADVRHEWLMNLCLILALVAVIAPLLLGLGLKSGLIKRIFDGFEHDPRYYEIASAGNPQQTTELLAFLKDRPEVEVVVRRLGAISGSVYVDAVVRGAEERPVPGFGTMDLEATEGKDKLLLLSGAVAPLDDTPSTGATGAVLNEAAAAKLSGGADPVQPGDILKIRVTRTVAGRLQEAPWQLRVQSIARLRSDANTVQPARLFVPLSLTEDVELFKTGSPVEARQWLGGARTPAAPVFDAAIVVLRPQVGGNAPKDAVPPKIFLREVVGVSGWAEPRILTAAQLTEQTGLQFAQLKEGEGGDVIGYVSSKGGEGAVAGDFVDLREFFRGRGYIPPAAGAGATGYSGIVAIIPWVAPRPMEFRRSGGISPSLEAAGYSADAATVHFLGLKPEPPWPAPGAPAAPAAAGEAAAPAAIAKILLPPGAGRAGEAASLMVAQRGGGEVAVPITAAGGDSASAKFAYLPAETAGLLRLAAGGDVVWVESSRQFYPRRARYAGFRLYTKKFEQVIDLEHALQMRGAEVQTQAAEISGAIELNHRLTALVQVTALVGGLGAVAVLAFSLFGSVERKRGDFAILRLIGTGRLPLLVFPIFESMTLAVLAYLVAWWGVFSPVASWINRTIGPRFGFQSQEALCWLPLDLALSGLALTLVVSIVVAIGAGWRAMLADPAAALRQE